MNTQIINMLPVLASAVLLLSSWRARRLDAQHANRLTLLAGSIALLTALGTLAGLAVAGPGTFDLLVAHGLGLSTRVDALSGIVFAVIAFVGLLVLRYSRTYLDGDPRQPQFMADLALTLAAAIFMTTSGNVVQLVIGWSATSLALHRLLMFYRDRPRAQLAGRKKYIVARLGDLSLAAAAVLLWLAFGTGDIATMLSIAHDDKSSLALGWIEAATLLIAVAALLKSAQFPTHGWLTEVMETPTPVSALLHAGIVNAGGFLVFRFADLMVLTPASMQLLLIVGGFTALFGSVVMTTQSSIKVSLAYSTIGQMGFMIMQCGFGAFSSAALHLVAHSLYKAHAFLSSGSAVAQTRTARDVAGDERPGIGLLIIALILALLTYAGVGRLMSHPAINVLAVQTLGAIFVMGLFVFVGRGARSHQLLLRVVPGAAVVAALYFALQRGAAHIFDAQVPLVPEAGLVEQLLAGLVLISFAIVSMLQVTGIRGATRVHQRLYLHLRNGLYTNSLFNRMTGAIHRDAP